MGMNQETFNEISAIEFRYYFANYQTRQDILDKLKCFYKKINEVREHDC